MNHRMMQSKEFDDADDLAPLDEVDLDEPDDVETAVEVERLVARIQATRFAGV
jgi:hypothetical protein